jgi:very-short-patch-repair endonuclease
MDGESAKRWAKAADLAAPLGLLTAAQLNALGIFRGAIEKGLRSGRLHRVHQGVYVLGHRPAIREVRWAAAVMACGPEAVLSHRSAAAAWGIRDWESRSVDVTSPSGSGRERRAIRVHRAPLGEVDQSVRFGIPVTSVARTVADLAHELDDEATYRMVREAQFRKLLHLPALELTHRRRPSRRLAAIIDDLLPTETPLEDLFVRAVVRRYNIPPPDCQEKVEGFRVDFHWPAARLIVETDGGQHADPLRMQADRIRDNVLYLAGQLGLRYTKPDVTRRHGRVADQIRAAIAACAG